MSIEEIRRLLNDEYALNNATGFGGTTTIWDQYKNADAMLDGLDELYSDESNDITDKQYNNFASAYNGAKMNAALNGAITGVTALGNIASNAMRSAQIADTTTQEDQIADLRNFGNYNYGTYDQLANDIANQQQIAPLSYKDIRGMSTGQQIGAVGSSVLTGAAAGAQIGGPWGAAIGGAVGLAGGLAGVMTGNQNAKAKQNYLQASANQASAISQLNLQAAHNRIGENDSRFKAARVVARGGQIRRKRESIQDFASRVLGTPQTQQRRNSGDITRTYEEGGVRIKIRKR